MDFQQKYISIAARFRQIPDGTVKEDFALQINLTDRDCGGTLYIAGRDGHISVAPFDYRDNTCLVTLSSLSLFRLFSGSLDPMTVQSDKILIQGNREHLRLVCQLARKPGNKTTAAE